MPATSIKELVQYTVSTFAIHVSISTAARVPARAKFTYKKAVKRNSEYNEGKGRQFVREIISPLLCGLPNAIASVDEAGFLNCAPKYGWAKRGQRAVITRPMVRGQKFSLLLCVASNGYCRCYSCRRSRHKCNFQKFSRVPATGFDSNSGQLQHTQGNKIPCKNKLAHNQRNGGEQINRTAVCCAICPVLESSRVRVSVDQTTCQQSAAENSTRITLRHQSRD